MQLELLLLFESLLLFELMMQFELLLLVEFLSFFILSHNSCKVGLIINCRSLGPACTCFSQGKKQPAISKYFTLIFLVSQLPMMSVTDADLLNLYFFLTSGRTISSHKRQEIWLNSFVPRLQCDCKLLTFSSCRRFLPQAPCSPVKKNNYKHFKYSN